MRALSQVRSAEDIVRGVERYGLVGGYEGALGAFAALELTAPPWRSAVVDLSGSREVVKVAPRVGGGEYRITLFDGARTGGPFEATADVPVGDGSGRLVELAEGLAEDAGVAARELLEGGIPDARGPVLGLAVAGAGLALYLAARIAAPVALVVVAAGGFLALRRTSP